MSDNVIRFPRYTRDEKGYYYYDCKRFASPLRMFAYASRWRSDQLKLHQWFLQQDPKSHCVVQEPRSA